MSMNKSRRSTRNPLNVAKDKIQETRDRIRGNASGEIAREASQSLTVTSEDETFEGDEFFAPEIYHKSFEENEGEEEEGHFKTLWETLEPSSETAAVKIVSSSSSSEDLLSEDTKQVLQCLRKPLILGLREITLRQPQDPVDYLACWLLNYRSCQEKTKLRSPDNEKLTLLRSQLQHLQTSEERLAKEAKDIKEDQEDEENGNLGDWNFYNYNTPLTTPI